MLRAFRLTDLLILAIGVMVIVALAGRPTAVQADGTPDEGRCITPAQVLNAAVRVGTEMNDNFAWRLSTTGPQAALTITFDRAPTALVYDFMDGCLVGWREAPRAPDDPPTTAPEEHKPPGLLI